MAPRYLEGPYSGSWALSPGDWAHAAAATTADGTAAVRLSTAASRTAGQAAAALTLASPADPGRSYDFRFDIMPGGGGSGSFTARNGASWSVAFDPAGKVSVRHQVGGKTATLGGSGDLTWGGKYKPATTWYRVLVRNAPTSVSVTVTARDSGGRARSHPGDPKATAADPLSSDVILAVQGPHDAPAATDERKLQFVADGAGVSGLLSTVVAAWPLVATQPSLPPADGLPPTATPLASNAAAGLAVTCETNSGRVFLRSLTASGAGPPMAAVSLSAEFLGAQTGRIASVPASVSSTTPAPGGSGFVQQWSVTTGAGVCGVELDCTLVPAPKDQTALSSLCSWSESPTGWLEIKLKGKMNSDACTEAPTQLRVTVTLQPTQAAWPAGGQVRRLSFLQSGDLASWPVDSLVDDAFPEVVATVSVGIFRFPCAVAVVLIRKSIPIAPVRDAAASADSG